jgi:hypothetical protein
MSERSDKRKVLLKPKFESTSDRNRRQSEQVRKEARSANMLAKRLKSNVNVTEEDSTEEQYSCEFITEAIYNAKVCL